MKKIMFNDSYGLTQAVLNGTKTMTRRIGEKYLTELIKGHENDFTVTSQRACPKHLVVESPQLPHGICLWLGTKYYLGEVVAVAQSYNTICTDFEKLNEVKCMCGRDVTKDKSWLNKMFVRPDLMPHQIQITDIKIERLQDISDGDCLREGVIPDYDDYNTASLVSYYINSQKAFPTPRAAFASLIDRISGKGTWQSNPIVVAYSFKLIK